MRSSSFHAAVLILIVAWAAPLTAQQDPAGEPAMAADPAEAAAAEAVPEAIEQLPETTVEGALQPTEVTTPTRTELPLAQVGSRTTVISSEQLQQQGYAIVSDALRDVPGVDVVRAGPAGGLTSVFLRGANSQHTKVLLDGIWVNDPSSASRAFDFSALSVDEIERIEVVRGPQSTLYGSDAIGGVISIVTKRGEGPPTVRALAEGGSFGTHREGVHLSGGTDRYHYAVGGSFFQTDGFSAASERLGNIEDDGLRLGTISSRFGWTPSDSVDVDCVVRWIDSEAEIDDAPFSLGQPPTDDPLRLYLTQQLFSRIQLTWQALDGNLEQRVSLSLADYDRTDTDDAFPTEFGGQNLLFDWQTTLQLTANNVLVAGVDYLDESASSLAPTGFPVFAEASQYKAGLYVDDQFRLSERWFATAGFRWDDYNQAGSAETYRFTSVYALQETGTSFHGTLGTGFRAPSLAENLFPFGNPQLRPERSKGWDVGATQWIVPEQLSVDATYFRNDITDLILFDLATFTLENIGQARTHGVEVVGNWLLPSSTVISASYTRTDTLDVELDSPLVRRPRDKGSLGIYRRFYDQRAFAGLNALLVGPRTDSRDGQVRLDSYTVVNLAGYYDVTQRTRLFLRLDNLFNEHYEEITGYSTAGFAAMAGLRCTW